MQFLIPTKNGDILYNPYLDKSILKESLRILLKQSLRQYFTCGVVANTLYPKLFSRFRSRF
jgi:hypothetical protein